jgi:hypothetical protein
LLSVTGIWKYHLVGSLLKIEDRASMAAEV